MPVHHIVIVHQVLPDVEMVALDLGLSTLDGLAHQGILNRDVLIEVAPLHQSLDTVAAEAAHNIVLERYVEAGASWVTLASRPPAELVVDAPSLMALGAYDVEATQVFHPFALFLTFLFRQTLRFSAQYYVNATSCHIGSHGH